MVINLAKVQDIIQEKWMNKRTGKIKMRHKCMYLIDLITRFYARSQGTHQFEMTDINWS